MANISRFTTPSEPALADTSSRSSRKRIPSTKKRRTDTDEMLVHMAQHREPLFCPTAPHIESSSIAPALPSVQAFNFQDTHSPFAFHHDLDDNEDGGVRLPPHYHLYNETDAAHDAHEHAGASVRCQNISHATIDRDPEPPSVSEPLGIIPSTHMVPYPVDLVGGEGEGELWSASQTGLSDEPRRLDTPRDMSYGLGQSQGQHHLDLSNQMSPLITRAPGGTAQEPYSTPFEPSTTETTGTPPAPHRAQEAYLTELDEDALAVDDPRRLYDFADFMDTWRLTAMGNKRVPPFEPGLQSSMRLWQAPEHLCRADVSSGKLDIQGIRWQLIGPSRNDATLARTIFHPSTQSMHDYARSQFPKAIPMGSEEETHYRFNAFIPKHKASFAHYQLRNLCCASSRNAVFLAAGSQVSRASLACPLVSDTVMDLAKPGASAAGFRITCLSASLSSMPGYRSDNVIIAGGFNGEYAVTNTESREVLPYEGFVTHAYNGLVTHTQNFQDRRSGSLKAAFCSNDRRVRVMDVQTLRFTESFEYQTAINCAAMSPDGRLRALVGDSTEVLITDAERGGSLVTLQEHTDHIFACSWSLDGRHVATGGQDGRTVIWDPRNWSQPLRKLQSSMSCARSLHFTDAGCLVVAENEDVVKIYDARDFHSSQEMRFFGSIAGVALIDGGEEIAVANADKTVGGLLTFSRTSGGSRQPFYRTQARALMRPGGRWRYGKTPFRDVDSLTDLYI